MFRCLGIVAIALAAAAAPARVQGQGVFDPAAVYVVPLDEAPARGPADAPVTIVEFSDFQCRYCYKAQGILEALERLYPGAIRLVYRHNPLDPEDRTLPAEAAAAAGAQGRFWAMHDRLFANPVKLSRPVLDSYALELGLDMVRFRRALDTHRYRPAVLADAQVAAHLGVSSTPMFFINGRPVKGAQPLSVFARVVGQELARARKMEQQGVAAAQIYARRMKAGIASAAPYGDEPSYLAAKLDPSLRYRVMDGLPGHERGPADAPVTIVELSDFECGFCTRMAPVLRAIEQRYAGKVRLIYRHFPLPMHRGAELAAEAGVAAAAQGKFWVFHDALFQHGGPFPRALLDQIARQVGLDMTEFRAALDDRRYRDTIEARVAAAETLGVSGTPTMFVNGRPIAGAMPEDALARYIDLALDEAKERIARGVAPADVYQSLVGDADVVEPIPMP